MEDNAMRNDLIRYLNGLTFDLPRERFLEQLVRNFEDIAQSAEIALRGHLSNRDLARQFLQVGIQGIRRNRQPDVEEETPALMRRNEVGNNDVILPDNNVGENAAGHEPLRAQANNNGAPGNFPRENGLLVGTPRNNNNGAPGRAYGNGPRENGLLVGTPRNNNNGAPGRAYGNGPRGNVEFNEEHPRIIATPLRRSLRLHSAVPGVSAPRRGCRRGQ